jgi:hypothetical protein
MAKNEQTSKPVATLASQILSGEIAKPTHAQILTIAASVLTQTPDKKPGRK